jgi:hypothetical protein
VPADSGHEARIIFLVLTLGPNRQTSAQNLTMTARGTVADSSR